MKLFAVIVTIVCLVAGCAALPVQPAEEDWQLIPDGNYNMHLVNIREAGVMEDIEPNYNPWQDVRFTLFTRNNPTEGTVIQLHNSGQLLASNFNPAHQTRFIVHGWNSNDQSRAYPETRDAYLSVGDYNVFYVDWSAGAGTPNYILAVSRVSDTGAVLGEFVDFLNVHGLPFSAVTVVGHSLGGHVVGFAGKTVTLGVIQNIISLDPAMPLFTLENSAGRVDATDGIYVEIIHTDALGLGIFNPIGDASFYPNWGNNQPGCGSNPSGCSHIRAFEFYIESVNSTIGFWATRCTSFADIQNQNCQQNGASRRLGGEPPNGDANGVFYLTTNEQTPFAQG